jgi:L-malate glycosyltransferase
MKKVCIYTENYYKGGLDSFLISLVNSWPSCKDEISLVCNKNHPGLLTIEGQTSRHINILLYSYMYTSNLFQGFSRYKFFRSKSVMRGFVLLKIAIQLPILVPYYICRQVFFFKKSEFTDLIVVNGGYPASLLCRCAIISWYFSGKKTKAIMNFHSSATKSSWYYCIPDAILDRLVVFYSKEIIGVSDTILKTLRIRTPFKNTKKLKYIHNGTEDLSLINSRNDNQYVNKDYCLILATYQEYKGHKFAIKSFVNVVKEFPGIHLYMFGYGTPEEIDKVKGYVKKYSLEDNVMVGGFIENKYSVLANAKILLIPSQAFESFGLTSIEAMSLSVPIVSTNTGGLPEVICGSNSGFICESNNPVEFSDSIIKLLKNDSLRSSLGKNGRKYYEQNYTAKTMAQKYYKSITK